MCRRLPKIIHAKFALGIKNKLMAETIYQLFCHTVDIKFNILEEKEDESSHIIMEIMMPGVWPNEVYVPS